MSRPQSHDVIADSRGWIQDLLTNVKLDSVTMLHTKDGQVRGNHWHEETVQWTFVVRGSLLVRTRKHGANDVTTGVAFANDLIVSPAGEDHAWEALGDTDVLVFTVGPRSGSNYESDTHRLPLEDRLLP